MDGIDAATRPSLTLRPAPACAAPCDCLGAGTGLGHAGASEPCVLGALQILALDVSAWAAQTFGRGPRTAPVLEHLRRECEEVEATPDDLTEWADVLMLLLDALARHNVTVAAAAAAPRALPAPRVAGLDEIRRLTWAIEADPYHLPPWGALFHAYIAALCRHGTPLDAVISSAYAKLERNRHRRWGAPDVDGVVEHVR